jgi:CRP-like cAMP-binding protein
VLVQRFSHLHPLSDHERNVLRLIERRPRTSYRPDAVVLAEKAEIRAPLFILAGWAARLRELADGRRQIIGILLPGDAIGLCARAHPRSLTSIISLAQLRVVEAPEIAVAWRDQARVPGLSAALDLAAAEEEFFMLCQIMRLGRQTAYERMAHCFMELDYRLAARGLPTEGGFAMPLTQERLADAVGLSVVHVNRTLQQMRREGRIELARGRLSILDRQALAAAGEFTPPVLSANPPAIKAETLPPHIDGNAMATAPTT